jgi:hypothetical protein
MPRTPTFKFFNVAIASEDEAIEAVREKAGAPDGASFRVVRQLSRSEVEASDLRAGSVKPA